MSRIFLSHSSANNAEAIALRDWLVAEGWSDLFLDLDPDRGIAAGERWERALNEAARRCEAVLFLISKAWLASRWCVNELTLARRLNKRLFGILIEEGPLVADLPPDVTNTWQIVSLATGRDHRQFRIKLPITGEEVHVTYSVEGLMRLKTGLQRAGLHASYFSWPPTTDPKRAPYRGLKSLEPEDAGIFFGREAPVIEAIDRLRGLTEAAPPRLMAILGASGAGKSSFLRAGLLPRLGRDPQTFLPLPVLRPERAALSGETGLVRILSDTFDVAQLKTARREIREAVEAGPLTLKPLLKRLQEAARPPAAADGISRKPPTLVLSIDQAEELFLAEAQREARRFLALLRDLLISDTPAIVAVFTIRSDNYESLQTAFELEGVPQQTLSLLPMPKGSYSEVIKGPIKRLESTTRALKLNDDLVDALLADVETGGAKDALPLLAFTLDRLYEEYGATGELTTAQYESLGGVRGSIEAAVNRAFLAADKDARIPRENETRLSLLRAGLIPWLAGIDPETKAPHRRVARLSEIPDESRPLIDLLVEQRLLATDVVAHSGEKTIEPAHEALLRQWGQLHQWLEEYSESLYVISELRRATVAWVESGRNRHWLSHRGERFVSAERVAGSDQLSGILGPQEREYLNACEEADRQSSNDANLVQSERMSAIHKLTGGIAHDFNNVLTAIIGFSDLLLQTHRPTDAAYKDIMSIKQSANQASGMIRQLLAFSRRKALMPETLDAGEVLTDLTVLLSRLIGEKVDLKIVAGRDLWFVKADRTQFDQVIINLAVNAKDAMPNGGKLVVRARNFTEHESLKLHALSVLPGEYVLVEVEDTGNGMPPEVMAKIFEPFFSTKEVGKGTGLGLSTVYGIVKQTGGYVFPESTVSRGTTFRVYLPRHIPEPCSEKQTPTEAKKAKRGEKERAHDLTGTGRVLLVEDTDSVRKFAVRALKRYGYEVVEASNGIEALEIIDRAGNEVNLVVSNIVMPKMDGPSLLKALRKRNSTLKIIFISGYPDEASVNNLDESDEFTFLSKPFSLEQLAATVKRVLED